MFSEDFRSRLALGKYTRWATDLDEERLEALLSAVGELGLRAPRIARRLDNFSAQVDPVDQAYARARCALEVIWFMVVEGRPYSLDEVTARIREAIRRARSDVEGPEAEGDG